MILDQFPDKEKFTAMSRSCNVIPVCRQILADRETPVSLLQKLYASSENLFLLESVEGGERWGRYSFLGTSPKYKIRVLSGTLEIENSDGIKSIPHNGDPTKTLRSFMEKFIPADMPELPRFWGGLVGYMTYEMVSFFENIPHTLPEETPLAEFIIPDELVIVDNVRNTLTAVVIAFTEDFISPEKVYEAAMEKLKALLEKITMNIPVSRVNNKKETDLPKPEAGMEPFEEKVKRVKKHIRAGDIFQAVISQSFTCSAPDDLIAFYRAQRYINPSPYLFFMKMGETTLIGSSPETMVRLENGTATLRPIAGTRRRGNTEQEDRKLANDLLSDEKEKAEHVMLVDLGRNDLGRVAETGSVQVTEKMVVERYSHVMHLVSNICCDLKKGTDAWDLLRGTFPAGTLSGAPKVRAMEIISELEENPRGPYGGAAGYISFSGNMDLAITIRTAVVKDNLLTVRAGAGIVADSDPEFERLETENKAKAIEKALELTKKRI